MHKIIVFDLDGTLAPIGAGTSYEDAKKLKRLEDMGYKIAICSGKPVVYLSGFARNLGLSEPILVGENGAEVYYGIEFPPRKFLHQTYSDKAKEQMHTIRKLIEDAAPGGAWYQPNKVCLTPFPFADYVFGVIEKIINENGEYLSELTVYRHWDCFDFVPSNISKRSGLELLAQNECCNASDFIALGDGINDLPMFEYADVSIAIGDAVKYDTTFRFESVGKALDFIIENSI